MSQKYSGYLSHSQQQSEQTHDENHHSNLDDNNSNHNHLDIYAKNAKILMWCVIITLIFSVIEAFGGYITHSIALESDAVHMLTDAIGLLIAYFANQISRKPANVLLTFGYGNAEAIGALINCIFTIFLTLGLLAEVIHRLFEPTTVNGNGLLIIATIGFIVNLGIAIILSRYAHSLNLKAAFIHALGDLFGSLIAIISGITIYLSNFSLIDPILSIIIIALLCFSNYRLIKKSIHVLMAGVPENLDYEIIGNDINQIEGILGVHDLHIWYLATNKVALSAHVIAKDPYKWQEALEKCQSMLAQKHKIEHITLQFEFKPNFISSNYCESC